MDPDARIRFREYRSGSRSDSGSEQIRIFFFLIFYCLKYKTHNDVLFCFLPGSRKEYRNDLLKIPKLNLKYGMQETHLFTIKLQLLDILHFI